jgi:DNA-binding NarL/FixJ family response regulator
MQFLIVDDHPLYREALQSTLRLAFQDVRIEEASSIDGAFDMFDEHWTCDLILLDLSMAGVTGFDGLVSIRKRMPCIPVLVVSGLDDPRVIQASMQYGAAGFVPKSADKATLVEAISRVLSGASAFPAFAISGSAAANNSLLPIAERIKQLTPQQLRVLKMIRQGKLNKQIAHELLVGDSTVKAHVSEILRKLGVVSRTQIVIETTSLDFDHAQ